MSEKQIETKFCVYMQQDVVVSGFNNDGECMCLNCRKKECNDKECRNLAHPVSVKLPKHIKDKLKMIVCDISRCAGKCSDCINATLYNERQK